MRRVISLLSLAALAGFVACETDQPTSISGPQLAKGGNTTPAVPLMASFRDAEGDSIVSDFVTDPYYDFYGYVDGSCGVEADLAKNSDLAWLFPRYTAIKRKERACGEARRFDVLLPETVLSGATLSDGWLFRVDGVRQVEDSAKQIAIFQGETEPGEGVPPWKCRFTNSWWNVGSGFEGDSVLVTREGDSWVVESVEPHRAVCTFMDYADTAVVQLPFQLTFTPKP